MTKRRQNYSEMVNQAAQSGKRFAILRNGKIVAGIVPASDLRRLEQFDDIEDIRAADQALDAINSGSRKPIPWKKARPSLSNTLSKRRDQ